MAESIELLLEVYETPTFSLSVTKHNLGAVIGEDVVIVVKCSAVGNWLGEAHIEATDLPPGSGVSFSPLDGNAADGEEVEITIDTTGCSEGATRVTIFGVPVV